MDVLHCLFSLIVPAIAAVGAAPAPVATPADPHPNRGLVIVLRPSDTTVDELTRTALARVTGELRAARFQVTILPLDPNQDPTPQVESIAPESEAVAALAIAHVPDANRETIAIWVSDRLGRRTTISRMTMRGDNVSQDAGVLALEAIELIRVSIAGLWPMPARSTTSDAANGASTAPPVAAAAGGPEVSVALGIVVLRDVGVPESQWMGSLTGMLLWPRGWAARVQLMGLGPDLTLSGNYGLASVSRQGAALGLVKVFGADQRVRPMLSMAVGAQHVTVDGSAADPTKAHATSAAFVMGMAGAGAVVHLGARIALVAEVDVIVTPAPVNVRIANTETETFSRPGGVVNAGFQASF